MCTCVWYFGVYLIATGSPDGGVELTIVDGSEVKVKFVCDYFFVVSHKK